MATSVVTGRCYCGAVHFQSSAPPISVSYCHCDDCRRVTSAPVAAFAAFEVDALRFTPDEGQWVEVNSGVRRSFCRRCGTPLTGRYDYLPGRVYVGVGLLDQAAMYPPSLHGHVGCQLPWLHIDDALPRHGETARDAL